MEKRKDQQAGRILRYADLDLNHNTHVFNVETCHHRDLSHYVFEDMLNSWLGVKFLVFVAKDGKECTSTDNKEEDDNDVQEYERYVDDMCFG